MNSGHSMDRSSRRSAVFADDGDPPSVTRWPGLSESIAYGSRGKRMMGVGNLHEVTGHTRNRRVGYNSYIDLFDDPAPEAAE